MSVFVIFNNILIHKMIFNDVYLSNRDLDNLSPIHSLKEKDTNPCTGMYYKEIGFAIRQNMELAETILMKYNQAGSTS